jgi:nucleoside-diphosphate-sugar epimerase
MHIFLTGGTGSIGGPVLRRSLAAGHTVTALVRSDTAAKQVAQAGVTPLHGDLSAPEAWMPKAAAADVFIHLASSFDGEMAVSEPLLVDSLLHHAQTRAQPLHFVYTGGCWMFGQTGNAVATESSPMNPIQDFDWATQAINRLQDQPSLNLVLIHPAMVYDETGGVFDRMITALRAGRPAPIWGSEHTRWPLVHANDAAAAYVLLAENPDASGTYMLVSEQGVTVGEIAGVLAAQAGVKTPPAVLPRKWALMRHGSMAEGPMLDQQMAQTRLTELGWVPEFPDFSTLTYQI